MLTYHPGISLRTAYENFRPADGVVVGILGNTINVVVFRQGDRVDA